MKPVFQTRFSPNGNCFQAALASVLELPIEQVPDFCNQYKWDWGQQTQKWLVEKFGCYLISVPVETLGAWKPKGYHLMTVNSPRGDFLHSLIGLDGIPIHDPYPGGNCEHNGIRYFDLFVSMMGEDQLRDPWYARFKAVPFETTTSTTSR